MRQGRQPQIIDRSRDQDYMREALALAAQGAALGEVPVGAVLVQNGEIIGRGFNCPISGHDPSAHAEMMAIRDAATAVSNYRLPGSTLYVTLEPCQMCAGALVQARLKKVVIGTMNPKAGCAGSVLDLLHVAKFNHQVEMEKGILEEECAAMLSGFFAQLRERKKNKK